MSVVVSTEELAKVFSGVEKPRSIFVGVKRLLSGTSPASSALRSISLSISAGEKVAILGKNGQGKSTLLRLLAGILRPSAGNISVHERPTSLFQAEKSCIRQLAALDNLRLLCVAWQRDPGHASDLLGPILAYADLEDHAQRPFGVWSAGQIERFVVAALRFLGRDVLLLDGFLSVSDDEYRAKIVADGAFLRAPERTVIVASHRTDVLEALCTKAIVLDRGEVRAFGEFKEVRRCFEPS